VHDFFSLFFGFADVGVAMSAAASRSRARDAQSLREMPARRAARVVADSASGEMRNGVVMRRSAGGDGGRPAPGRAPPRPGGGSVLFLFIFTFRHRTLRNNAPHMNRNHHCRLSRFRRDPFLDYFPLCTMRSRFYSKYSLHTTSFLCILS
jgi:hypothetical protein